MVSKLNVWRAVFVIRDLGGAERGGLLRSAPRGIAMNSRPGAARSEDHRVPPRPKTNACLVSVHRPSSAAPVRDFLGHQSLENLSDARAHPVEGRPRTVTVPPVIVGDPVVRSPEQ